MYFFIVNISLPLCSPHVFDLGKTHVQEAFVESPDLVSIFDFSKREKKPWPLVLLLFVLTRCTLL